MIKHGADVNCETTEEYLNGWTALMLGSLFFWNIHSVIKILNTFTKACQAHTGHIEVVEILLANGADLKIKNKNDQTALDIGELIHSYLST